MFFYVKMNWLSHSTHWLLIKHKNQVVHVGKQPNPLDVILISQSLMCRYKEAHSWCSTSSHYSTVQQRSDQKVGGPWQLIIKVAAARVKKFNRFGFAYEAKSMQTDVVLQGIASCTGIIVSITIQEAMIKVAIKARSLGFNHILFLCDSRRAVNVTNSKWPPN